jgi:MarR family transcriptional regulator, organic hydroperoxide resistance regulator
MESPQDWPTGRLLSTAARLVEHAWAERLETVGLTHAGLIALHLLGEGARSQSDLARSARVQLQTMARTVERLERHGHVTRQRDAEDARRVLVARTPEGAALLEEAGRLESEALPPVSDPAALRALLLEVVRSASGGRFPAA